MVGRTQFCIHPKSAVSSLPVVGGTKKVNMDKVRALAPTHALLNIDENPKQMANDLAAEGIKVVVTHPMGPDDNLTLYALLGHLFNCPEGAQALATQYISARDALSEKAANCPPKRVLYLIWKDPWMAAGPDTYIANMLRLVNWRCVTPGAKSGLTGDAARYPVIELDSVKLSNVDVVLFSTEPYAFTDNDLKLFQESRPHHEYSMRLIDGEMLSWYGKRAPEALRYLFDLI